MRRYLVISDEMIQGKDDPKPTHHVHFDILADHDITLALERVIEARPAVSHTTYLTFEEVEQIFVAMYRKSEEELDRRFKENTKCKSV